MNGDGDPNQRSEVARLKALAMTHIEDAAMWAVKAATKPAREAADQIAVAREVMDRRRGALRELALRDGDA